MSKGPRRQARPEDTGLQSSLTRKSKVRMRRIRGTLAQFDGRVVESRCDAVVIGSAYLLPALSVAGASLASP